VAPLGNGELTKVPQAAKGFLAVLALLICRCAIASDIVVVGKLITNEPMSYVRDECPDRGICLHSWWKAVIQVEKTLQGTPLSGRITAAVMQHTSMNAKYKKAVRYFVLEAIEDPSTRKRLRADYYLKEGSIDPPDDK
jgi:hypothetical protein